MMTEFTELVKSIQKLLTGSQNTQFCELVKQSAYCI